MIHLNRTTSKTTLVLSAFFAAAVFPLQGYAHNTTNTCVSFRGNGPKFPSLMGQTAALLEHGYVPDVSVGGSSGASVAAITQALLENQSLRATGDLHHNAALILHASQPLLDTFMFLPKFNTPMTFARALLNYLRGQFEQDKIDAPAAFSLAHLDHTLAQVLLFIDFYQNADFSPVLAQTSASQRQNEIRDLFVRATGALQTSPDVLMRTLLPSRDTDTQDPTRLRILNFFADYLALDSQTKKQEAVPKSHSKINQWVMGWMSHLSPAQQSWARSAVWNLIRRSTFFPGTELSHLPDLILHSPKALQNALQLRSSFTAGMIRTPQGFVAHTTAFTGARPSVENLKQFYLAHYTIQTELRAQWHGNGGRMPVLTFKDATGPQHVLPPENIWVPAQAFNLREILQATIAEPLLFERRPMRMSEADKTELQTQPGENWIANGGWLDTASDPLLRTLSACQGKKIVLMTPRDGINSFQKQVLRGMLGLPKARKGETDPLLNSPIFRDLNTYLRVATESSHERMILDFDWDNAIKSSPQGIASTRQFLFDAGYAHARRLLRTQP